MADITVFYPGGENDPVPASQGISDANVETGMSDAGSTVTETSPGQYFINDAGIQALPSGDVIRVEIDGVQYDLTLGDNGEVTIVTDQNGNVIPLATFFNDVGMGADIWGDLNYTIVKQPISMWVGTQAEYNMFWTGGTEGSGDFTGDQSTLYVIIPT